MSAATALVAFFKILPKSPKEQTEEKETIRLRLARGLLLALDFEVGSDILKTILVPSANELTERDPHQKKKNNSRIIPDCSLTSKNVLIIAGILIFIFLKYNGVTEYGFTALG